MSKTLLEISKIGAIGAPIDATGTVLGFGRIRTIQKKDGTSFDKQSLQINDGSLEEGQWIEFSRVSIEKSNVAVNDVVEFKCSLSENKQYVNWNGTYLKKIAQDVHAITEKGVPAKDRAVLTELFNTLFDAAGEAGMTWYHQPHIMQQIALMRSKGYLEE